MSPSHWDRALDAVSAAADAKGAVLLVVDSESDAYNVRAASGIYAAMFETGAAQHYLEHLAHYENAEWDIIARQRAQRIMLDSEMIDPEELDQREDCRFLRKHAGVRRRLGVRLNDNRAWFDAMTVQYNASIRAIPEASLRLLQPLLPHLAKTVEIGRAFAQLQARYAAVLAALDNVYVGLAIATASGEIVICNTEAERIFGLKDGVTLSRERRIICRGVDQTAALQTFIRECAETAGGQGNRHESFVTVSRPSRLHPLLVEVSPLSDSAGELETNLKGALVTLIDAESAPPLDVNRFAHLHGLTPAESEVCALMIVGLTGPAIAERRDTSPETVKSQMSSVLAKTGATRRLELIRLVVRTIPPIG